MKKRRTAWFYIKRIVLLAVLFFVATAVVVKLRPETAALIADNYLRPMIGTDRVAKLEELLFNTSDRAAQFGYQFKQPTPPGFLVTSTATSTESSKLTLTNIPVETEPAIAGEGIWQDFLNDVTHDREIMAYTFVRPDPARSFAIVSLVQMDMKSLRLGAVAGTKEPGGSSGNPGPGAIPQSVIDGGNLIAAFNGGFLYGDGNFGMMVDGKTYAPLQTGAATVVGYKNGSIAILSYQGQDLGKDVVFARQNGPLIIDNGTQVPNLSTDKTAKGKVLHGGTHTWRSGIGVTKEGNLIYAAGNNLTPDTLAHALLMAGCVNAMELDINPSQVRFDSFKKNEDGSYTGVPLNKQLAFLSNPQQYLKGYTRDFFYVYKP